MDESTTNAIIKVQYFDGLAHVPSGNANCKKKNRGRVANTW